MSLRVFLVENSFYGGGGWVGWAEGLSRSVISGLLRIMDFSRIFLFICYRKFSVVLLHGTACGVWGRWGDLTGRSATVWSARHSWLFQDPRRLRRCPWPNPQSSWSVSYPGWPYYTARGWTSSPASCGAVWELPSTYRPPVHDLFIVGSATSHWWRHARDGYAPFGSSKALPHVRGPRTTSQGPSSGSWFGETPSRSLLRSASGSLDVAWTGPRPPPVPIASGCSWPWLTSRLRWILQDIP